MGLPKMPYSDRYTINMQNTFMGINHRKNASEGEIYDMSNLSSDLFPLLSVRKARESKDGDGTQVIACAYHDGEYSVKKYDDGVYLVDNGRKETIKLCGNDSELYDKDRTIVGFDRYIVIMPDKMYYDTGEGTVREEAYDFCKHNVSITDGDSTISFSYSSSCRHIRPGHKVTLTLEQLGYNPIELGSFEILKCDIHTDSTSRRFRIVFDDDFVKKAGEVDLSSKLVGYTLYIRYNSQETVNLLPVEYELIPQGGASVIGAYDMDDTIGVNSTIEFLYFVECDRVREGDEVKITRDDEELGSFVVRGCGKVAGLSEDSAKFQIAFDNDVFETTWGDSAIVISHKMPDMDYLCVSDNRLWGCKEDTIYASKLGDFRNFNVFEAKSTDSYSVNVSTAGSFTGCYCYNGYPMFFKEDKVYKMYGDRPANFQLQELECFGVKDGCEKSLAVAGNVLFYFSPKGVCAYTGSYPSLISECFGTADYSKASAGSDGIKYYISLEDAEEMRQIYVYDTRYGLWHKESADGIRLFCKVDDELIGFSDDGMHTLTGGDGCNGVKWSCEFADVYEGLPMKKTLGKLYIRLELDEGAEVEVYARYDGGEWNELIKVKAVGKASHIIPIIPARCDHMRLKLTGVGGCVIYSITREYNPGSYI